MIKNWAIVQHIKRDLCFLSRCTKSFKRSFFSKTSENWSCTIRVRGQASEASPKREHLVQVCGPLSKTLESVGWTINNPPFRKSEVKGNIPR